MSFKNVALTGASGNLGVHVVEKLINAGTFTITVLRRNGSSSTFPSGVKVVDVDFESVDSLTTALKGQDVFISMLSVTAFLAQKALLDASIAAGVKRFIPSEYGCNLLHPKVKALPIFAHKVEVEEYLFEKLKASDITYTLLFNNPFLDWGLKNDFLLRVSDYKPIIFDSGDVFFSTTTLTTVADALVSILNQPEETKNRHLFIKDTDVSQNKLLDLAKKAAPGKPWEATHVKLDDVTDKADARLAQGLLDAETFVPYLYRANFDPSYEPVFEKTDNELLGIKLMTDDEVFEVVKRFVK